MHLHNHMFLETNKGTNTWLIPVLPQLIMLFLMSKFYQIRAETMMQGKPLPEPHFPGTPPKIAMTSADTFESLQQIQNTMGVYSDMYDAGYELYRLMDWSSPEKSTLLFQALFGSIVATWIVNYLIPINIIALVGGVSVFLANTAIFKASSRTLTPVLYDQLSYAKAVLKRQFKRGDTEWITPVVLHENQRWWAGLGFSPALLSGERSPWTDEAGLPQLPKDLYSLPEWVYPAKERNETRIRITFRSRSGFGRTKIGPLRE
jgi:Integral peroxisomal membrane peroxin